MSARQEIVVESYSLEEAREEVKRRIPSGFHILSERVLADGQPKSVEGVADTLDAATKRARGAVPPGIESVETKVVHQPATTTSVVEAFDEATARETAQRRLGRTEVLQGLRLESEAKKGFLGIGKRPARYAVDVLQQAVVTVAYDTKAKISVTVGEKGPATGHCQMCGREGSPYQEVGGGRVVYVCSDACANRYGELRTAALKRGRFVMADSTEGWDFAASLQASRRAAAMADAFCWHCGKTLSIGSERCAACGREVDPHLVGGGE